jgi:hypothetical protein
MSEYFSGFQVVGEVADTLLLNEPTKRLLIDISSDSPGHEKTAFRKYPNRTTLTIFDPTLIDKVISDFSIGDVIKAVGSFSQSGYVPFRTAYIDTTFEVKKIDFVRKQIVHRSPASEQHSQQRL